MEYYFNKWNLNKLGLFETWLIVQPAEQQQFYLPRSILYIKNYDV